MTIEEYILSKSIPRKSRPADETEHLLASPANAKHLREALATPPEHEHVVFTSLGELTERLEFKPQAFEDLQYWVNHQPKVVRRILRMIDVRSGIPFRR